jgi:hypothetical protein
MDKTGKVKSLNNEIKKLEKLREEIQSECKHKDTYLKFEDGGSTIRVYCRDCEKNMGVPNPKDVELFLSGK